MEINGRRVGDELFTPGWTSYKKRLQYQVFDITDYLTSGANAVGLTLGDGWFRGKLGFRDGRNVYGESLALLLQLKLEHEDGTITWIVTDESWKAATGPILWSDIYMGEHYDARLEMPGWSSPGYDDRTWKDVRVVELPKNVLVASEGPPVRRIQEIRPVEILYTPSGDTVFDMGQNMVGWVRLRVKGRKGKTVTLRHAEVLDKDGNFYTENLRKAAQRTQYTMKGRGIEVFEPHFTFQGFRYVAVDGYPGKPDLDAITGIVIHSDMAVTGTFESSHPLINQLQNNIQWGQRGNFLDVPTDCPQRDERLGWTGDAQVFAETATFNMDVAAFFTKWLQDLAADQLENGSIPWVIPDVLGGNGSAAWADAGVIIPWVLFVRYGDRRILESQYESMQSWIRFMKSRAGDDYLWKGDAHFGDWLAYSTTRSDYPGATTDKDLIATAFFSHSTGLVEKTARVLGREEEARRYRQLRDEINTAFRKEYVTENGRLSSNTQTAYVLALEFDLLPPPLRSRAAERLAEDVRRFESHLTTGFVGTPYLCHVLSQNGYLDLAYELLEQETYPSWLYPVKQGATTIWERWDGIRPDGSFQSAGMNSFNHYAYGAIGSWLYGVVAGIRPDPEKPGFKKIVVQPRPGGTLTRAAARLDSMYGSILSAWDLQNEVLQLKIEIPPNTDAAVHLPHANIDEVRESGQRLGGHEGIRESSQHKNEVVLEVGSGSYDFVYPWQGGKDSSR
jgi:alpha-L-rhamnosidase